MNDYYKTQYQTDYEGCVVKLADFNKKLKECPEEELSTFAQKYIFHGLPLVFNGDEEAFFEFRNRIAKKYGISFHEVFIVGSAKLGFSYRKQRDSFDYDSDIDVTIVSQKLFEDFSVMIRDYQYAKSSGLVTLTEREEKIYKRFLQYFARGWIRPDLAKVLMGNYPLLEDWDEFFNSISNGKSEVGNYAVDAGIFKSYDYLQKYHFEGLKKYQQVLKA